MKQSRHDRLLGMDARITRRDFLNSTLPPAGGVRSHNAHEQRVEAVKKLTAPRKGAKAQRKASQNSFNFAAGHCRFAPLREISCLRALFFHTFTTTCMHHPRWV